MQSDRLVYLVHFIKQHSYVSSVSLLKLRNIFTHITNQTFIELAQRVFECKNIYFILFVETTINYHKLDAYKTGYGRLGAVDRINQFAIIQTIDILVSSALRILCICFETRMAKEWPRIVRIMRDLGRRNEAAPELWSFLEFVVTHRTPLYIVLMPFILHKVLVRTGIYRISL